MKKKKLVNDIRIDKYKKDEYRNRCIRTSSTSIRDKPSLRESAKGQKNGSKMDRPSGFVEKTGNGSSVQASTTNQSEEPEANVDCAGGQNSND